MTKDTPVILLHGAGGHSWSMKPIEWILRWKSYPNVHIIDYDFSGDLKSCIDSADDEIRKKVDGNEVVIIGQSLGGVIGSHLDEKGWNIKKLVTIVSPLHGANFINTLSESSPKFYEYVHRPVYKDLSGHKLERPECECISISTSLPFTDFDGCVFKDEAVIDKDNHYHIPWSHHATVFFSFRLMKKIYELF